MIGFEIEVLLIKHAQVILDFNFKNDVLIEIFIYFIILSYRNHIITSPFIFICENYNHPFLINSFFDI